MQKFKEIVVLDKTMLTAEALEELQQYSASPFRSYEDYPADDREIMQRIGQADGLLLSWQTQLSAELIGKASGLRYIGMCCSLYGPDSANVDIGSKKKRHYNTGGP